MQTIPVKFKMNSEQFQKYFKEYLRNNNKPDTPYFNSFAEFLNWKFSDLIDKKIDEVINANK